MRKIHSCFIISLLQKLSIGWGEFLKNGSVFFAWVFQPVHICVRIMLQIVRKTVLISALPF